MKSKPIFKHYARIACGLLFLFSSSFFITTNIQRLTEISYVVKAIQEINKTFSTGQFVLDGINPSNFQLSMINALTAAYEKTKGQLSTYRQVQDDSVALNPNLYFSSKVLGTREKYLKEDIDTIRSAQFNFQGTISLASATAALSRISIFGIQAMLNSSLLTFNEKLIISAIFVDSQKKALQETANQININMNDNTVGGRENIAISEAQRNALAEVDQLANNIINHGAQVVTDYAFNNNPSNTVRMLIGNANNLMTAPAQINSITRPSPFTTNDYNNRQYLTSQQFLQAANTLNSNLNSVNNFNSSNNTQSNVNNIFSNNNPLANTNRNQINNNNNNQNFLGNTFLSQPTGIFTNRGNVNTDGTHRAETYF